MPRIVLLAAVLVTLLPACGGGAEEKPELFPASCRLPSPSDRVNLSRVPDDLLVDDRSQVRSIERIDGLLVVALNVPMSVDRAYQAYLEVLSAPPYELIGSENEGFEMEIYARDRTDGDFVAVQARNPGCDEAVSIYLQLGKVPSPVGTGTASPSD
ncbi:MAG: hypothetical protein ACLGHL_10675 [Actinomycetota bacterium]